MNLVFKSKKSLKKNKHQIPKKNQKKIKKTDLTVKKVPETPDTNYEHEILWHLEFDGSVNNLEQELEFGYITLKTIMLKAMLTD